MRLYNAPMKKNMGKETRRAGDLQIRVRDKDGKEGWISMSNLVDEISEMLIRIIRKTGKDKIKARSVK